MQIKTTLKGISHLSDWLKKKKKSTTYFVGMAVRRRAPSSFLVGKMLPLWNTIPLEGYLMMSSKVTYAFTF